MTRGTGSGARPGAKSAASAGCDSLMSIAFRAFARLRLARRDAGVEGIRARSGCASAIPPISSRCRASSCRRRTRTSRATFIERLRPDIAIARCKVILKRAIFEVPRAGTFVLHPGICPEYRNAHGCFWALARRDLRSRRHDAAARRSGRGHRARLSARHATTSTRSRNRTRSSSTGPCSRTSMPLAHVLTRSAAASTSSRSTATAANQRSGVSRS